MVQEVVAEEKLALNGGPRAVQRDAWQRLRELRHGVRRSLDLAGVLPYTLRGITSIADGSGPVGRLERGFAELTGARHALSTTNGTAALHSAYFAVGVGPGSEVILPAYTWHATATPVLLCGAVPVFAEIDPETLTLDPLDVERRVTERTRAIGVLHPWGNPAPMDRIVEVAERHGLAVVEDCSHAHGSRYRGRSVGTWGDVGCFSLQGAKTVEGGEAGVAVTNDPVLYDRMLLLGHNGRLAKGQQAGTFDLGNINLGVKYRIHPVAAVLANASLKRLAARNCRAAAVWELLCAELADVRGIRPIAATPESERGGYYSFLLDYTGAGLGGPDTEQFVAAVRAEGAPLELDEFRGRLLHQIELFAGFDRRRLGGGFFDPTRPWEENVSRIELPVTEAVVDRLVRFTVSFATLPDRIVRQCADAVRKVLEATVPRAAHGGSRASTGTSYQARSLRRAADPVADRQRVALVGCGRRGRAHLEMLVALRDRFELVGVCDRNPRRLAEAAAIAPDSHCVRDVRELLRLAPLDWAVVCTLQDPAPAVTRTLLEAGIPALVEVPPAYDGASIRSMIDAAERRGLVLASAENYTRTPIERVKQHAIRAGVFGEIESVEVEGSVGHKGHEIALARSYIGTDRRPVRVRARADGEPGYITGEAVRVPPLVLGEVEFDSGARASFILRAVEDRSKAQTRSEFSCRAGECRGNRFFRDGVELPLQIRSETVEDVETVQEIRLGSDPPVTWTNAFGDRAFPPASRREYLTRVDDSPRAWEIAMADTYVDTSEAVAGERRPEYTVEDSLLDVRIRLALLESVRRGEDWIDFRDAPFDVERLVRSRRWLRRAFDARARLRAMRPR